VDIFQEAEDGERREKRVDARETIGDCDLRALAEIERIDSGEGAPGKLVGQKEKIGRRKAKIHCADLNEKKPQVWEGPIHRSDHQKKGSLWGSLGP